MEQKNLRDLSGNPKNPRRISDIDFDNLKQSMTEFGDLSGVVFNVRTGNLVGGHQRRESFIAQGGENINITQRFNEPTSVGTVALGYVILNGEQYGYREVDWPEDRELAANIAANRIQGEWDLEKLGEIDQWLLDNNPDLLPKTGQHQDEIDQLLGNKPEEPKNGDDSPRLTFKLTEAQRELIETAIAQIKHDYNVQNPINDDSDGNALTLLCKIYLDNLDTNNNPAITT